VFGEGVEVYLQPLFYGASSGARL